MNNYIDTKSLSTAILKEMLRHNISQELFARKVIFRSQGTLSELLHKPKKWEALSTNGRKNYMALRDWLHTPLPDRVQKLYVKDDKKVARPVRTGKRRHASPTTDNDKENPIKRRLVFSEQQKETLAKVFAECTNPSYDTKKILAKQLNLVVSTVNNYFMNARRREKHELEQAGGVRRAPWEEESSEGEEEAVNSPDEENQGGAKETESATIAEKSDDKTKAVVFAETDVQVKASGNTIKNIKREPEVVVLSDSEDEDSEDVVETEKVPKVVEIGNKKRTYRDLYRE